MKPTLPLMMLISALCCAPLNAASSGGSRDTSLNSGWRFVLRDVPGAEQKAYDDRAWSSVTLPHCWNVQAGQDGDSKALYKGAGWYRRHLTIPAEDTGNRFFIRFGAAFVVTDVYVNGAHVGQHDGGFAAFCFDVTRYVKPGTDNVISVRVQGSPDAHAGPPQGGDYSKFGGLYRGVKLLTRNPLCISPLDYASPGVYLKQLSVSPESADVEVSTVVGNWYPAARQPKVRVRIVDAAGKTVATGSDVVSLPASATRTDTQRIHMKAPHLWNGTSSPYVYRAVVELSDGPTMYDRVEQPLGLRYFRVDPAQGFFLNGKSYPLHGVNRHQDRLDKGWAISEADTQQDVALIREMGVNSLRTAHYQQDDDLYTLCDRNGTVVWTELCLVNNVRRSEAFRTNTRQQLEEMIKQCYNHPSICFWSLFNEIFFEGGKNPSDDDLAFLKSLNEETKRLDSTRLTTGANCSMEIQRNVMPIPDLIGWNGYYGWYSGTAGDWSYMFRNLHTWYPDHGIGISEYGAGASIYHHESVIKLPPTAGPFHPEEYQAYFHEKTWKTLESHTEVWGTFLWNMFDFASITRKEGDHRGRNDKGLVTYDRKVRKDAFYFFQAQWANRLMVHITGQRFNPRPSGATEVKVYSNADRVELWVNGKSMGATQGDMGIFRWNVTLPSGDARVEAVASRGAGKASDDVVWACSPSAPDHIGPR